MSAAHAFVARPAVREQVPLLIGLCGPSSSGKTYSALELATGIQSVVGGDILGIDTEARRMLHYADRFTFKHCDFGAPFSSARYLEVIAWAVKEQGARTVIVDSMSHEHEGPGGYLEAHEKELDRLAGDDKRKRGAMNFLAWAKPAQERRALINGLLQLNANMIFCFRAKEKLRLEKGKDPVDLGWQPIAGQEFAYEMTMMALLPPGARGVPDWGPTQIGERAMVKLPQQFDALFPDGRPFSREQGVQLARWAKGEKVETSGAGFALTNTRNQTVTFTDGEKWAATGEQWFAKADDATAAKLWRANRAHVESAEASGHGLLAQRVWIAASKRGVVEAEGAGGDAGGGAPSPSRAGEPPALSEQGGP